MKDMDYTQKKMKTAWKSSLQRHIKVDFFKATVKTFLMYRSGAWTLTVAPNKKLGNAYTKMHRAAHIFLP